MLPGTAALTLAGLFLSCPVISLNDELFHRKIDLGIRPSFSWPLQQPILVPCSAVKGKWTRLLDLSRMSGCGWEEEGSWALVLGIGECLTDLSLCGASLTILEGSCKSMTCFLFFS